MEKKPRLSIHDTDQSLNLVRAVRVVPPAHYVLKIESFSLLTKLLEKSGVDKYESKDFDAGGYKWRLLLYPDGIKKRDVNDQIRDLLLYPNGPHISLYLEILDAKNLPIGSEVNVVFKFFVLDQIREKYLTLEDVSSFNALMTVRGIARLLPLITLNDPSNGYLIDDCCIFGAEVFVVKSKRKGEILTMRNEPDNASITWKIEKFAGLTDDSLYSDVFTVEGCQWKLQLYPCGESGVEGKCLSLFLILHDHAVFRTGWKVYVEFKLIIMDQVHNNHHELTGTSWFCSSFKVWGFPEFILLDDLKDENKGFIVHDTLVVEGKITFLSAVNSFA